jgi:hypothetical protein
MWDVSIAPAGALILRTFPFMLLRAAVYFGIAAAFVVAAGGGAGVGWAIGTLAGTAGRAPGIFWGAVGGLALVAFMLWWLREYLLYLVEANHAAAMALAAVPAKSSSAQGSIPEAMTALQRRFREARTLFSAERLVHGAIGRLIGILNPLADMVPADFPLPRNLLDAVLRHALGFVGKAILARTVLRSGKDPWPDMRDSLVLLAQNHAVLMRNAILLAAFGYGAAFVLFFISLIPALALAQAYPGSLTPITILLALIFAWSAKQALIEPLAIAAFLELYVRVIEGQKPDPDWDIKLTGASEEFREIKARAAPPSRGMQRSILA